LIVQTHLYKLKHITKHDRYIGTYFGPPKLNSKLVCLGLAVDSPAELLDGRSGGGSIINK
jgi:hypothetical protein